MLMIVTCVGLCLALSGAATLRYYMSLRATKTLTVQGLDGLRQLIEIIKLIQQHRALHGGYINGNREFGQKLTLLEADLNHRFDQLEQLQERSKLPYELGTKSLHAKWQHLLNRSFQSSEHSFATHSTLISRALDGLWEIADKFSLTTSQDAEVRNLANKMVKALPELTESLAQIRGLSVQVAARHAISADKKLQLMYILARIDERLSTLTPYFPEPHQQQLKAFLQIIRSGTENANLGEQDPDYLFKESTQVIDKLYDCILEGFQSINQKVSA
ncbi:nitrate- and nitrite sensing domain-containing protein [Marinomonas fungiae]|uniref:Nitrate/nitrite sensing protein domain-containing protein n=1 Tax=Marinomonas fungiae TaxID=1137284 RepID=A0A0K6IH60_9GAMM|nr:nitrate- and nitrite sensing domain-containing protein [Marinomonas fungiae]CUB02413.1 hypothetical protein Ga0061065_101246 [Marinomonas fungiae]